MTSTELSPSSPSAATSPRVYPQIILFGDSITQQSELTFAAALREKYVRRADILNRGFSGYTSKLALDVLPNFFPVSLQADVPLMTVFFGANDACLPGSAQHVPIDEYIAGVKNIVQHELVRRQRTKVILIIPGPVDEYQLINNERTAANTKLYADACRQIGNDLKLPLVDLWSILMDKAGWDGSSTLIGSKECGKSEIFSDLLSDGLHFTAEAYSIMFQELMKVMYEKLPEQTPEQMPMVFPAWSDLLGVET
jgi:lysophospholipase L1-like esterase